MLTACWWWNENNINENEGVCVNRLLIATFAVCLLGSSKALADADCAAPQDLSALETAALQQQLMVAALTCRNVADYNNFVISHQTALQESDQVLLHFFVAQDDRNGTANYSTYKTRLANDASLRSLHDPLFCASARAAFDVALAFHGSLAQLVSIQPSLVATGYKSCALRAPDNVQLANSGRDLPVRQQALPVSLASPTAVAPNDARNGDSFDNRAAPAAEPTAYAPHASWVPDHGPQAGVQLVQGLDGRWYPAEPSGR